MQEYTPFVTSQAVDAFLSQPVFASDSGLDILLTHLWPISISQHSPTAPALVEYISNTAPPLDEVVRRSRPRYHFAAGGKPSRFWEREAFAWEDASPPSRATRFISLGSFGEPERPGIKKARVRRIALSPVSCLLPPFSGFMRFPLRLVHRRCRPSRPRIPS